MLRDKIIVAIDGYSSCGKSTFAKAIAARLGYVFVDTGAMYRALTLWAMRSGLLSDKEELVKRLDEVEIKFRFNDSTHSSDVMLNGQDVSAEIRLMEVSGNVSSVSQIKQVRQKLVSLQQQMGTDKGMVMDGRDIGTVVFPQAEVKIFMTASVHVRAQRRYDELVAKGEKVSIQEIEQNIAQRDFQDENRTESPLRRADDAHLLDNSHMTVDEQMKWFDNILKGVEGI